MRTICPRCGVTSKDEAEFCVSCGQPLKSAVSSVPPARPNTRSPVSEVNVNTIVVEDSASPKPQGAKPEVSVRYRTISTIPKAPGSSTPSQKPGTVDNFRETILLHAPTSRAPEANDKPQASSDMPQNARVYTTVKQPEPQGESADGFSATLQTVDVTSAIAERPAKRSPGFAKLTGEVPSLGIQHIWYKITGDVSWHSVALVPASDDMNLINFAHGLGTMAVREPCEFVRVVNASIVVYEKNEAKAAAEGKADAAPKACPYEFFDLVKQLQPEATSAEVTQLTRELLSQFDKARKAGTLRDGKVFVTIDSIFSHPDAIALCRAVDKIIICIRLGDTRIESVRKTIETVGREKILGCVTVNG